MAEKCANCGSADTYPLAGSNGCYDCGNQTVTGDVEIREDIRSGEKAPAQNGEWVARPDVRPPPPGGEGDVDWVSAEDAPERPHVEGYGDLTADKMRAELTKRELDTDGSKHQMVARLKSHDRAVARGEVDAPQKVSTAAKKKA
jgi:hypothetical protein